MTDPLRRAIVINVIPVGPRAPRRDQWFAINVSAGLRGADTLTADDREQYRRLLQPWNWGWASHARVNAYARDIAQATPETWYQLAIAAPAPGDLVPLAHPDLADTMLDTVKAWLDRSNAPELRLEPPAPTLDRPRAELPTFAEQLAHLATYPGALPQHLGLVSYVKLAFPEELDGKELEIVIAPTIDDTVGTLELRRKLDGSGWEYAGDGAIETEPLVKPLRLESKLADGMLGPDPSSAWVRIREIGAAWSEQLKLGCNAVVDIVRRVAEGLEDKPVADDAIASDLLQAALRYYVADDPWPTLEAFLAAEGATPIPQPYPPLNWTDVFREGGGSTSPADLAALAPGADVLWWLWRWAPRAGGVAPAQLTLQEGRVKQAGGWLLAPGAARREAARQLAHDIVTKTRDNADGTASKTPHAAAVDASKQWLAAARTRLKQRLQCATRVSQACSWLDEAWDDVVDAFVTRLWDSLPPNKPERPLPQLKQHGITVQLDEVGLEGDPEDKDLWRELSGVALFVQRARRDSKATWRIVNGASVMTRTRVGDVVEDGAELYTEPVVVPTSLPFLDGVRSPFLSYDHRSLVAHVALDAGGSAREVTPSSLHARIAYRRPTVMKRAMLLPQLRYGDSYKMAVACFDLGGGVPSEICDGVPWRMRADYALTKEPPHVVGPIEYKRKVPVGQIRFARTDKNPADVPANVFPLARELPAENAQPMLAVVRWDRGVRRDAASAPILSMQVRAPAVDIDVVERSVGVELAKPARLYLLNRRGKSLPVNETPADAFDDPAVTKLCITVEKLDLSAGVAANKWETAKRTVVELPSAPNFVTDGITIKCWFAESTTIAKDGSEITLGVGADELPADKALAAVFRIELSPWVSKQEAARCDPVIVERVPGVVPILEGYALPGHVILIERASRRMPTDIQIGAWFNTRVPDRTRREVELYVSAPTSESRVLENVRSADVLRHVWRWDGRPRMRWPEDWPSLTTPVDRSKEPYRKWEETAFIDLDPPNGAIPPDALCIPVARFHYGSDDRAPALLRESWERDVIAHYVRYVLRVQSRYAGMWDRSSRDHTVSGREVLKEVVDGKERQLLVPAWRAVYLPPRSASPRVPVIRAIIPLTAAEQGPDHTYKPPGVMVVLDEPMFRDHGVSEGIVAQIDTSLDWVAIPAMDSEPARKEPSPVLEYGHDPIVTPLVPSGLPNTPVGIDMFGPYGITLDDDSNPLPLFNASCYLLKPPFDKSRAWDFARVRFRRVVHDNKQPPAPGSESEWTRPYWIQFVAPSGELAPADPTIHASVVSGLGSDTVGFGRYAIVTARIHAYHGGAGDELYLDAFKIKNGQGKLKNDRKDLQLFVRVAEVQATTPRKDDEEPPEDLWEALFPKHEERDAWLRITRISPPRPIRRV